VEDTTRRLVERCLTGMIKCAVSPGTGKERKLVTVSSKLPGSGIIIAPDHECVRYIAEMCDNAGISCAACHLEETPESNDAAVASCRTEAVKVLVADAPYAEHLTPFAVRFVIHWSLPASPSAYVRSICRFTDAARESFAVLFYEPGDRYIQEEQLKRKYGGGFDALRPHLSALDMIERYAAGDGCRIAFLADALQTGLSVKTCGRCDNCRKQSAAAAIDPRYAEMARILLRSTAETREKFGIHTLTDVLRANYSEQVKRYNLDRAPAFGTLRETARKEIVSLFRLLIKHGYLKRTVGTFPTLYLTALGKKLLGPVPVNPVALPKKMTLLPHEDFDIALMEVVRNFRRDTARRLNIPAFMVFPDAVLKNIVMARPAGEDELKGVRGVGKTIREMCGEELVRVIRSYLTAENNGDKSHG